MLLEEFVQESKAVETDAGDYPKAIALCGRLAKYQLEPVIVVEQGSNFADAQAIVAEAFVEDHAGSGFFHRRGAEVPSFWQPSLAATNPSYFTNNHCFFPHLSEKSSCFL